MPHPAVAQTRELSETLIRLYTEHKINDHTSAEWALKYAEEAGVNLEGLDRAQWEIRYLPYVKAKGREALVAKLSEAYRVLADHVNIMGCGEKADDPLTEALRDHAYISNKFAFAVLRAIGVNCKGGGGMKDGRIFPTLWKFIDDYVV